MERNRKALLVKIMALPGGDERSRLEGRLEFGDAMRDASDAMLNFYDAERKLRAALKRVKNLPDAKAAEIADNLAQTIADNTDLTKLLV